jgi:Bacterial Ig-like domain (group 2)
MSPAIPLCRASVVGLLCLTSMAGLSGCGGPTSPTTTGFVVSCAAQVLTSVGQTTQCSAIESLSDGSTADRTASAQWSSSTPATATVSPGGLVTAVQAGSTRVTATYSAFSVTSTIQVSTITAVIKSISLSTRSSSAIVDATLVHFDVTGSAGQTIQMNFGDGQSSSTPSGSIPGGSIFFEHTYSTIGGKTATLTVSDAARQVSATAALVVIDLTGTWTNTIVNPSNGRVETRTMTWTGGGAFTGAYTGPEGTSLPLTGTVNRFGSVNVTINGGALSLQGVDLDDNGMRGDTAVRLIVTGGTANGLTLTYTKQ